MTNLENFNKQMRENYPEFLQKPFTLPPLTPEVEALLKSMPTGHNAPSLELIETIKTMAVGCKQYKTPTVAISPKEFFEILGCCREQCPDHPLTQYLEHVLHVNRCELAKFDPNPRGSINPWSLRGSAEPLITPLNNSIDPSETELINPFDNESIEAFSKLIGSVKMPESTFYTKLMESPLFPTEKIPLDETNFANYYSIGFLTTSLVLLTGLAAYVWWSKKINNFRFVYAALFGTLINLGLIQLMMYTNGQSNQNYTDIVYQTPLTLILEFLITVMTLFILLAVNKTTILDGTRRLPAFEYQLLMLWALLGLLVMLNANDLLVLYFGIECQAIASYVLTGLRTSSSFSTEASLKYLLISGFGTALMLFGISFFYGNTGSTNIHSLLELLRNISFNLEGSYDYTDQAPIWLAFSLIIIGFVLKIGIAPYHVWMPDVYQGAPTIIVGFFASVPKFVLIVILAEIFYNIQTGSMLFSTAAANSQFSWLMFICAFASILIGSLGAFMQTNMKRFLAYSSIAHVGYMFLTMCLFNLPAVLYSYLAHYLLVTILLFAIVANTKKGLDDSRLLTKLHHLASLQKANKTLTLLFIIVLFSSAGLPPFWGFFPKLAIFMETIDTQYYFLALWIFITSCLTIFVYMILIKKLLGDTSPKFLIPIKRLNKPTALSIAYGVIFLIIFIVL